jgi:glycosyltransferase involved in cell wall biosynthesis
MKIEIAIPCYNEEVTVQKVVRDFHNALPQADIVVYDNNSTDRTAKLAVEAGAKVLRVNRQGKGFVVQKIFETTPADIVVMVDGDDTYEAMDVDKLIEPLVTGYADMTVGTRLESKKDNFRAMHHFGNRILTRTLNFFFKTRFEDILSGYRGFNRRFVENVPLTSQGFTIETELMIQALENGMAVSEIPIRFRERPEGSHSKLNTFSDGYNIILLMVSLLRDHRPLLVFSLISILFSLIGIPVWLSGYLYGEGNNFFSVMRSIGALLIIFTIFFFMVGLILNTINTRIRELLSLAKRRHL